MKNPTLSDVEDLARSAGAILRRHFGALGGVEKKGARDLVTVADRESEAWLVSAIQEQFPSHRILAEEGHRAMAEPPLWIIDPLDGTTNFVHRIPHVAVSIAFVDNDGVRLGAVFNPILDECFLAERGAGATLAGRQLRCSRTTELGDAVLATGFAYQRESLPDSNLQHFADFAYQVRGLRRLGSAALDLCYTADGRMDGFWELWLSPWDVAAGALIAAEAGCEVSDFDGGPGYLYGGRIVAANPELARKIRAVIASADPARLPGPAHRG